MLHINQYGGGACSLCGSAGTNKTTCPLNQLAKNKVKAKHPLAAGAPPPPIKAKAVEPAKRSFSKTPESFYGSPVAAPALPLPLPLAALPAAVKPVKRSFSKTPDSFYGSPTLKALSPVLPVPAPVAAAAAPAPAPAAFKRALPPGLMLNLKGKPPKPIAKPAPKFGAKAMGVINNLFKHFYPIWATYHVNNGKSYNGMFVGHKSSAEARGFVEYIYEKYHTDPETMDFWLHGTTKEILDELAYDPSAYVSFSGYLKGN